MIVIVYGKRGVGKSALVDHLAKFFVTTQDREAPVWKDSIKFKATKPRENLVGKLPKVRKLPSNQCVVGINLAKLYRNPDQVFEQITFEWDHEEGILLLEYYSENLPELIGARADVVIRLEDQDGKMNRIAHVETTTYGMVRHSVPLRFDRFGNVWQTENGEY